MIQDGIFLLLTNNVGVSALVLTRVYPLSIPQNAVMPCISYSIEQGTEDETFDGQNTFRRDDLQIDCWANSYSETLTLAAAVKAALQNYSGTTGGVKIQRLTLNSSVSVHEDVVDLYRTSQGYSINI